ncbi:MAG: DEAD/DEAH box helicase [Nanoarchaeota archaeon]|nr:DEAD/DEAH box helicase [Nanoarchaeota archaeon]
MTKFSDLGLKKDIVQVLTRLRFKRALEVQRQIIPMALLNKNIVFTSRTGSGKTLAYTVGFLSKINKKLGIQMLVMVPTRELAIQVGKDIKQIADPLGYNVGILFGGRDIENDSYTLRKRIHIMVATPGRVITHINQKTVKVGEVKCLVFDESDQMFDQGFYIDCAYIKSRVGKLSQIILSSATISDKVKDFMEEEIVDYDLIRIGEDIPKNICQEKIYIEDTKKNELLLKILEQKKFGKVLIFTFSKARTYQLADYLKKIGINARELNSDLEQTERINNLNLFKQGSIRVLVATDIAARGLQIEQVDLVINYDVPNKTEFYVHRIGRSGREDKKGHAITFISPEDEERFEDIMFDYQPDIRDYTGF